MALTSELLSPWAVLLLPVLFYLLPYIRNASVRDIPGPKLAAFSNLWLMYHSRRAERSLAVHAAHQKYGKFVRVQPHHVSVADDSAIQIIYGHGNGFLKSEFYDAFVSIQRGLFNTRDRAEHTRKRKIISHTFSAKSVGQFEQYIHHNLDAFVKQWDQIAVGQRQSKVGSESKKTMKHEHAYESLDALHWFNYLAFDIIGDLAFGAPFGMVRRGADIAEVRMTPDSQPTYAPAVEVLNRRGEVSATIGCYPAMKPWARNLPDPFFSKGVRAVENLAGIAVARVRQRLNDGNKDNRVDLLARLMEGKDDKGEPLGRDELTAEALTQLIAGSDTTSNTSCAILFHCLKHPEVVKKLHKELDSAILRLWRFRRMTWLRTCRSEFRSLADPVRDSWLTTHSLETVIKEAMRIHSTSSMGLPRLVPGGSGIDILGHHFPPGTVLSVPAYTIHHSTEVWGEDADEFDPERWSTERITERQKEAFIPFSYGPRACVGRNVAEMELKLIMSTVFRRYEFLLEQEVMGTREGFLRKPEGLRVGMRKRVSV